MDTEYVCLGRDNVIVRQLLAGDEVEPDASKVEISIGGQCLNSQDNPDQVSHSAGTVTLKLGNLDIPEGPYQMRIYAYDGQNTNGVLWDKLWVIVQRDSCDVA